MAFFKKLFGRKEQPSLQPSSNESVVVLPTKGEDNFKIAACLSVEDFNEYSKAELKAIMQNEPQFSFLKEKWDKAKEERKRRDEYDALLNKTAELNNKGIAFEDSGDVQSAIEVYEENLSMGYPARHAYDRLMVLYRKQEDKTNEERVVKLAIEKFPDETKYQKRLALLQGTFEVKEITSPITPIKIDKCWGDIMEERILQVPEFDFYCEQETNPDKYANASHDYSYLEPVWEVQRHFKKLLEEAKREENLGYQETAVLLYEQAVAEKYYMPEPYDRLVKIYSKAKLYEDEKRILLSGIDHFKELREKRKEYVLHLAKKYNAIDFATERIDNGKKITYFNGVFELYNPFPIVERWQERAEKKKYLLTRE